LRRARRRSLAAGTLIAALLFVVGSLAIAQTRRYPDKLTGISIFSSPIEAFDNRDPTQIHFGQLEFRGGLVLVSKYRGFGGLSGIHLDAQGTRLLGVTDKGSWLSGRIVYRAGRPARIADAEMAPILGRDGKPLAARGWYDVEALAQDDDGKFYVGIERVEKIVRFDVGRDGLTARGDPITVPADFKTFTRNRSLECLAVPPKGAPHAGALIAVTEQSLDAAGNLRAYVIKGDDVTRFSVKRSGEFDVTDCAILPPADLLLLERRYSLASSLGMRIRRIPLATIKAGAVVDSVSLIEADLAHQIDNMEGIAVHRNARGETIITLVSDDNFSPVQRNLLLQFALVGD
jgi:hypothetical protein